MKPAGKSERLYDRRSSSLSRDLAFFIEPTFWACRRPCADDVDGIALVGMGYREASLAVREPKGDPSGFIDGVTGSAPVIARGSASTVLASSKDTLCFLRFVAAFRASQVTRMG